MKRHKFLTEKRDIPADVPTVANLQKTSIEPGQMWKSTVNGSRITILSHTISTAWLVEETFIRANGLIIDNNGTKEMLESFILSFYKKL